MNATTPCGRRTARRAIAFLAIIACALAPLFAGNKRAFAAQGTITIEQQHNLDATYDAYHLFAADVDGEDHATHVSWASEDMRSVVLDYLASTTYDAWLAENHPGSDQHDLAQHAAEYIAQQIASSPAATGASTVPVTPEGSSFAWSLAQCLSSSNVPHEQAEQGVPFVGEQGFWLFVTSAASEGLYDEAGSAPIWVALGGSTSQITEKASVPTVDKQVWEDATQAWGTVADAQMARPVTYRLVGTLPDNFNSYASYHYVFHDSLSQGLEIVIPDGSTLADSLQVTIDDTPVAVDGAALSAHLEGNQLTVEFADLRSDVWDGFNLGPLSRICVLYQARLNDLAVMGNAGNPNDVYLSYTNDPLSGGEGETTRVRNALFSYAIRLRKLGRDARGALPGAEFVIRRKGSSTSDETLYVQKDGSLGKTAQTFITDGQGQIALSGLDAGSYLVTETKAPEGYAQPAKEVEFHIAAELNAQDLCVTNLSAGIDAGDAQVDETDAEAGLIGISIPNTPLPPKASAAERLAQTGVGPIGGCLTVTGLALIGISRVTGRHTTARHRHRRHR